MAHRHRYTVPVRMGGELLDWRCRCGLTLTEQTAREVRDNTLEGITTAGVVTYVPISTLAEETIESVLEDSWRGR